MRVQRLAPSIKHWFWFLFGMGATAIIVVILLEVMNASSNSSVVVDRQQVNARTLNSTAETLKIVKACTTPGQTCYERNQKRTKALLGNIATTQQIAAAAATSCVRDFPDADFRHILQCTTTRSNTALRVKR